MNRQPTRSSSELASVPPVDSEALKAEPAIGLGELQDAGRAIMHNVETVIDGKHEAVQVALTVLLAEGHLLIVSHTDREDRTRIVGARRAMRKERKMYEQG